MASLAELYNPPPTMSNPLPPQQVVYPTMSTPLPPNPAAPTLGLDQFGPTQVVGQMMDTFTNPATSPYIQNARRRGLEAAQQRGLLNSSIAAGSAERAGIEAAQPLVNQAVGLLDAREARALNQAQFDQTQNFNREQLREQAVLDDWLQSNSFNRQFNANLSLLPINNTFDLLQNLMQYGTENPQVWTPDIISGTSNFFTNNMFDILNRYFPGTFTGSAGGG